MSKKSRLSPRTLPLLRATFVTLSLDAGVPIRDVMASMGVSDMSMVQYYDRAHASIRRNASHRLADYLQNENWPPHHGVNRVWGLA